MNPGPLFSMAYMIIMNVSTTTPKIVRFMLPRYADASPATEPGAVPCRLAWVYPLPPDGPLEIFVATPSPASGEFSAVLDGVAVRGASTGATVIWT
jgi:hypothetical protein